MKGLMRRAYKSLICSAVFGLSLWGHCAGFLTSALSEETNARSNKINTTSRNWTSLFWTRTTLFQPLTSTTTRPSMFVETSSLLQTSSEWLQTSPSNLTDGQTSQVPDATQKSSPKPNLSDASTVKNAENIIRIVGIIGAVLAAVGLTYIVLKVTKCCMCLRSKDNNDNSHLGSSLRERVRLAHTGVEDGNVQICINTQDTTQPLSPTANNNIDLGTDIQIDETTAHDSDTDSLQEMNELPPSYESLYLNELGEPVSPPKYSPPAHRTHPPRRVNTFN